jgi:hypothetical protein
MSTGKVENAYLLGVQADVRDAAVVQLVDLAVRVQPVVLKTAVTGHPHKEIIR